MTKNKAPIKQALTLSIYLRRYFPVRIADIKKNAGYIAKQYPVRSDFIFFSFKNSGNTGDNYQ